MPDKKRDNSLTIFLAIIAFVAGILGIIFQGVIGLLVVISASLVIWACYLVFQYFTIHRWENEAQKLFKGTINPEYLNWQQSIIEQLYPDLEIVSVLGRNFPAAILHHIDVAEYPFSGLCNLQSLILPIIKFDRRQRQYLDVLGDSLRAPKMKGYALAKIHFSPEGKTRAFDAVTTNQEQNLVTCHILEWELYKYFISLGGNLPKTDSLLNHLPYRASYHASRNSNDVISSPHSAYPLISLQAIVIFKDIRGIGEPVWRVVLAKRSDEVIVKPGFFQFQPAGGFEVYGSQDDNAEFLVKQGFDIGDALLREYAEELFDVQEFQENIEGRDPYSIRSHPVVRQLVDAIKGGTAWFEFIGTIFDLTILRPELSFLILIEDDFFCKSLLLGSWESKNILTPNVDELGAILANNAVHCSSAGLLQLAIENRRLKELGIADAMKISLQST